MKNSTRSAVAATALAAAGLAVAAGAVGAATAAPRILNHEQLRAGITAAVAAESVRPAGLPGWPTGIGVASAVVADTAPGHPTGKVSPSIAV